MNATLQKILVVGGNGFIGSAVCKAAVARGMQVTSISSSGKPYRTPKGHTPAWVNKVDWQKGDALHPSSFSHLFTNVSGVVHTLGTLIEDADGVYKRAIRTGDIPRLLGSFFQNVVAGGANPLETKSSSEKKGTYELMNRDSALRVCEAFMTSSPSSNAATNAPRPFIYISAEDIFSPIIPARYIETKREAEQGIEEMMVNNSDYRAVYIRPSLVYHAHQRPLTTPMATLFDLSATLHAKMPRSVPTPSNVLRSLGSLFPSSQGIRDRNWEKDSDETTAPAVSGSESKFEDTTGGPSLSTPSGARSGAVVASSPLESLANALETPPIHVDQVADAIMVALDSANGVRGAVGVRRMRELTGWSESGGSVKGNRSHEVYPLQK